MTIDSEATLLSAWQRPRRQSARSAGTQHDAAAVVGRVQPGRERPVTDLVGDRADQYEVHPADQFGVVPGQGVEGTVGQGDDRGLATGFIPCSASTAQTAETCCSGRVVGPASPRLVSEGAAAFGGRGVQCFHDRGAQNHFGWPRGGARFSANAGADRNKAWSSAFLRSVCSRVCHQEGA